MGRTPVERNRILAGGFLIASLAVAVYLSFVLSDVFGRLGSFHEYRVLFTVRQGTAGLKPNSPVLLGGQPVGRVTSIEPLASEEGGGAIDSMEVRILVRRSVTLYEDAVVELEQPLLAGLSSLNFSSVGGGAGETGGGGEGGAAAMKVLAEGGTLRAVGGGSLLEQAGVSPSFVGRLEATVANIDGAVSEARTALARVDRITAAVEPDFTGEDGAVRVALRGVGDVVRRVDERSEAWSAEIDAILAEGKAAADQLEPLVVEVRALATSFESRLQEGSGLIGAARALVDENRDQVDLAIDDVAELTAWLGHEFPGRAEALLARGGSAADEFRGLAERVDAVVARNEPALDEVLTRLRQTGDGAALFVQEVRAQPWRLLQRPNTKELREQLVYDAARAYAVAAGDLREAAASVEALVAAGATGTADGAAALAAAAARLREATAQHAQAERGLLDRLIELQ